MNRELIPKEADEPPPSKTRRPPQRPNACPIGDDIAEEYHSESCVAHEISSNQQPPRASTEPTPYSPTDLTHNGKQSTATSDTLFPASETPNGTIPLPQEERSQPKHRFPRLHKRKQGDTTEDGTPLARKPSKKKKKFPKKIPVEQQLRGIFWSWPNILLICVPVGIALNYAHVNPLAIFIVSFCSLNTVMRLDLLILPGQLSGYHTAGRYVVLCDRRDCFAGWRNAWGSSQCYVRQRNRAHCFDSCVGQRRGKLFSTNTKIHKTFEWVRTYEHRLLLCRPHLSARCCPTCFLF